MNPKVKCSVVHLTEADVATRETENRLLAQLPHEDWCDMGETHRDCCRQGGTSWFDNGCSCLTSEVVAKLRTLVWTG